MGNIKSKQQAGEEIDKLAYESIPVDVWSKIADGADTLTRDLMFKWMDSAHTEARKVAIKEKEHGHVEGSLTISNLRATKLHESAAYSSLVDLKYKSWGLEIQVQDQVKKTAFTKNTSSAKWADEFTFDVKGNGVVVHFKFHQNHVWHVLPLASAEWHLTGEVQSGEKLFVKLTKPFPFSSQDFGKFSFSFKFTPSATKPANEQGDKSFIYAKYLPVLDPDVPLPALAKPDKAFTKQDDIMTYIMAVIAVDWMVTGAVNTRKTVPLPLTDRVDDGEGDEWWTNRRLNGDCPGFIQPNPEKTQEAPWDYQIEWDFRFLDVSSDLKSGVNPPVYICARFTLVEEQGVKKLVPHSIKYIKPGEGQVVQKNDGSVKWKNAKIAYRAFEMNAQFTYTHVGVHFNVEQYAMALYRNLSEGHPIWTLLTPHFKNVLTNNRKVVRPKPDGVVTEANTYTYDGQIKLLQDRFKGLSFKNSPHRVVPANLYNNAFENTQEVMWDLISQYVEDFFTQHPDISVDAQIQGMSKDLVEHALNPEPLAMEITSVADLKQLCCYVIFQAIFYHAWVHWNNYDDFVPVLHYNRADTSGPSPDEAVKLEDKSNMIQTFVEYVSPWLKQWPILDPELGGPQRLQELLWQNASKINPAIQVATLIMAPNA